jgi:hypothetical protein
MINSYQRHCHTGRHGSPGIEKGYNKTNISDKSGEKKERKKRSGWVGGSGVVVNPHGWCDAGWTQCGGVAKFT